MKKNIIAAVVGIILIVIIVFLIFNKKDTKRIAWVNINKVYNEFVFKKELESKLTITQQARKTIIDSAEFELKVLSREIKAEKGKDKNKIALFEVKRENYINKKNELEQDNEVLQKQYNEQILNQINQYLKDYGKQNKYAYILGADGGGTLMYADETNDITEAIVSYINEKYKGKTK